MTRAARRIVAALAACVLLAAGCAKTHRSFATPEDAVHALTTAVKAGNLDDAIKIFGPEGQTLIDTSDAATARRNREVFAAAVAERWHLESGAANSRVLVIGNEDWPFPVPLVQDADGWRFDAAAGKEEILARRAYVEAQHLYAMRPHDGQPAGRYATKFRSDPGRQNGLYWPASHPEKPSPLGDLVAQAEQEGRPLGTDKPQPFHGYYFRILPADGGFGLIAWPAQYDATGVMTFVVSHEGIVRESDLGPDTDAAARAIGAYKPDDSWTAVSLPRATDASNGAR
jgi:hypothetical protein